MAELSTLARPYAKAAFEYAVDAKDLQGWSDSLKTVAAVCQNDKVVSMLNSPSITLVQQAKRTIEICGNEINLKTQGFISVLAENKRLKLLPQISKQFETNDFQQFLELNYNDNSDSTFKLDSDELVREIKFRQFEFEKNIEFSDFLVYKLLSEYIPKKSIEVIKVVTINFLIILGFFGAPGSFP